MTMQVPDGDYPIADHRKWASIVPAKRGFIRLGRDGNPFAIALFHQLHCVNTLRFTYVATRDGLYNTGEQRADAFGHSNHCLDLLRHSIMCKADTTLLPVDSSVVVRRCRNSAEILEYAYSNQAFWDGVPYKMEMRPELSWDEQ
ncbi:hypothetical protein C8R47DRAFT_1227204 [Mycena vitilis]|nr:hypothetical protein C8R47DRAFT_1227204 [Mycena vitilis]